MYIYIYIWNGHPYTQSHTMPRDDSTSMNIERDRELLYMGCIFCNGSICDIYILCFDCVLFLVRVSIVMCTVVAPCSIYLHFYMCQWGGFFLLK